MAQKLEFIFDFSSPYGYLGATVTDQITAEFPELEVVWRPYLMGAAMKRPGSPRWSKSRSRAATSPAIAVSYTHLTLPTTPYV